MQTSIPPSPLLPQMGFGGLPNSLAVAFDSWYNPEPNSGDDVVAEHISVHSMGHTLENRAR